jgi:thiol-disulfide isomerase/thioredoxin
MKNMILAICLLGAGFLLPLSSTYAQQHDEITSLNIGDVAPALQFTGWIKGSPIQKFEKGKVYVLEYWATWCKPCKAAMPHLSELARKYRQQVTIIGVDVHELKTTTAERVKFFVDSMGRQMDYLVASQDSNMAAAWFDASGEMGIPKSFVVDADGRIAWIGHPSALAEVLSQIVDGTWDMKQESARRREAKYLAALDDSLNYDLMNYDGDWFKQDYIGKPDSALLFIAEQVRREPKLKYAPRIAFHTFKSLLKTDQQKAYEYGKVAIQTPVYEEPAYGAIMAAIEAYSDKLNLGAQIYQLGAEAYQMEIDNIIYPQLVDLSKLYSKMAEWYWRGDKKSQAISAQKKAVEALKSKKGASAVAVASLESRLQYYKKS